MSNKPPIEVPQGAIRFNTESHKLEFYAQDRWHEMASETSTGLSGKVFRTGAGSGGNIIETFNVATEGNAIDTGFDLYHEVHAHATGGSRTRAIQAGGRKSPSNPWPLQNVIQYFEMNSLSNSIDFGDLTQATGRFDAHSDQIRMVTMGQQNATSNHMDLITIPTLGNATDFGNSTQAGEFTGGCGSRTRGLWGGRSVSDNPKNTIDYVTIATTGDAIDFGDLSQARYSCAGMSNSVRGAWACGYKAPGGQETIDYVSISTLGNAVDFGDADTGKFGAGKFSSPIRCGFMGGTNNPVQINYININQKSDSTRFGDLTASGTYNGGHSDVHGGII